MNGDIRHTVEEFINCPMLRPDALETHKGSWSWGSNNDGHLPTEIFINIIGEREEALDADIWPLPPVIVEMIREHTKQAVKKRLREIRWALGI